ncbi:MAG: FCD domain-containing protein [Bacteroidales bacterium]|jgi:DNA-binding FadR family transcriptional regulator|nr:FCD domain-containing protein [Bacteroidales bacterium]MCI2121257.1 FCD domain-containing protein [Bacteroidales bacterium]MCI2146147.1 FCD domain-containing protein [Bacteroidales bacterium]
MSELVDLTEQKLLDYFRGNGLRTGDGIPNEVELSKRLGVARTVLREALSRFKMNGMIECRTKRGMVLHAPEPFRGLKAAILPELMDKRQIAELLQMRIALESGLSGLISANVTHDRISQLRDIVEAEERFSSGNYSPISDYQFHMKLLELAGNDTAISFFRETYPVVEFADRNYADTLDLNRRKLESAKAYATHRDLTDLLEKRDTEAFSKALSVHLKVYDLSDNITDI